VPTIVTSGGNALAISGTEHVFLTFDASHACIISESAPRAATSNLLSAGASAGGSDACAIYASIYLAAPAGGITGYGAMQALSGSAFDLADTEYFYGVRSYVRMDGNGPGGGGTMAWGHSFLAKTPNLGGGGNFSTTGLTVEPGHRLGAKIGTTTGTGVEIDASTGYAVDCLPGSDRGINLAAATTWDIHSAQTKVKFLYADHDADTFWLDADAVAGGRTSMDGLLNLKWKSGALMTGGVVQRMYLDGAGKGGVLFSATADSRHASSIPLVSDFIRVYSATSTSDILDSAFAVHTAFYSAFSFESNAGNLYDSGPKSYGLYIDMPETRIDAAGTNHYHQNDIGYATERYAIKVNAGETSLRRTYMTGPTNLGKSVLHVRQADENQGFVALDGSGAVDTTLNLSTLNAGADPVDGPLYGAGGWHFTGMFRVSIVDDNAVVPPSAAGYWVPFYVPV
jgi:hypothetical protein